MTPAALVRDLQQRGVKLAVHEGQIRVNGPLTDKDRLLLKGLKPGVLRILTTGTSTPAPRGEALSAELKSAVRQAARLVYGRSVGLTSPEWSAAEAEMDAAVAAGDRPRFEAARKAYLELAQRTAGKACTP